VYHLEGRIRANDISRLDEVTRLYQALRYAHQVCSPQGNLGYRKGYT